MYQDTMAYVFNNHEMISSFNFFRDSNLRTNLKNQLTAEQLKNEKRFKAFIQTYNHVLINNLNGN